MAEPRWREPDFVEAVERAVKEAGALALAQWRNGQRPAARVWEKARGQLLCDVDLALDVLLKERLSALLPDAGWLSEETADSEARLERQALWVVDPLDGTRDYVRGRTGWAVSVALVEREGVEIGFLSAPARAELWRATRWEPARLNGQLLEAGLRRQLAGARMPSDDLPKNARDLTRVAKPNSIALRLAKVASDDADLVATSHWSNEWDIAAATLIAQRAGAVVTDGQGRPLRFNKPVPRDRGIVCAAPGIHAAALERFRGSPTR